MKSKIFTSAILIFTFTIFNLQFANAQMFWNQACQFAGTTSSYITVSNSSSINITGSFSIDVWLNPSSLSGIRTIMSKGATLGTDEYGMQSSGGRIRLFTNSTIRVQTKISTIIPLNQWTHIAGTYNSSTNQFRIYVNGILDSSSVVAGAAPPASTDSLYIGSLQGGQSYAGQMDELRLWNRELSTTEVGQYFRTTLVVKTGIYSGLVMAIPFQGNQSLGGFTLTDFSGTSNSGVNRGVSGVAQFNRPLTTIMPNESVELDGTEDYLACADSPILSPTTGITLEAWLYPRNSNPAIIMTKGTNYRLGYNGVQVTFSINNNFFATGASLPVNQWSHVALSYSGSTGVYEFYLNGILRSTSNIGLGNVINGTDSLFVGGGSGGLADLNGFIDEVRISSYAKSQTIINKFLYQSIEDANQPDPLILQAVYSFDGVANSGADGAPTLIFRNNARFSHPGTITNQPISPLNRNDNSNFSQGYYMKTSNKRIPASGTSGSISDSTIVNLNTTITDVNLFVALNHANSFSLEVVLVAPNNDSVKVFDNKNTISTDDNLITVFNDQADSSLLNNRYATFSTVIKPENNMNSIFSSDNSQGRWKLIVRDEQANDTGFLYAWGIQFNNLTQRPKDLTLSALIQGFYNPSTNIMVEDTATVYVRNGTSPFAIVDSSIAVLNNAGLAIIDFDLVTVNNNQQYYLQLKHRNSIETWSNLFSFVNDEASYSFINAASAAFGSNQIQVDASPVRFAIYSGDVNQDGIIDVIDLGTIDNDAFNFVSGYFVTDINGDNFVDIIDLGIADNNAANFVSVISP